MPDIKSIKTVGIMGFGAFGRLIAEHLQDHFTLRIHDPSLLSFEHQCDVATLGDCDLIILAVPVQKLEDAIHQLNPHLKEGTIIVDVGSVKLKAVEVMQRCLPPFVEVIGTHPLFGPQSAKDGVQGHKVVLCPVRGKSFLRIAAFLKNVLGLQVFIETADKHDRDVAMVQGLTHLIARILLRMEPFPKRLTTASFDRLVEAVDMVRHDSENVYQTIERDNPHAARIRDEFFKNANDILAELDPDTTLRQISN
ncbi:prephenate dehydrogenase [Terasakiella sp. A23]|uniref:prephenate dehydrogenase n=1 Tax=Terasakiella sp. FCG-A23 TaxID=3080561 RepID=UPI0029541DEB|nr:prephenate dehydrogenase [Terasakiella sp. A23]MDV7341289.1 prephenate dehydrogenase [Terasakiella sp. A23]